MNNQVYTTTPKTAHVKVKGNGMNIDLMLKIFKRKVKESGILELYKAKSEYIKPSKRRSDKKNAAKKRQRKLDRENDTN
jgi:ribosomal protein S21